MLVFIHSNFKLDLTYLKVTFIEENQMFKDDFSLEISFPFQIPLDSEFTKNSGFTGHYNAHQDVSLFNGRLDRDGVVTDAVLKIQSVKGKIASAVVNSGLQAFPSFDKKLSELPLEIKPVENIIDDAISVIKKPYPATNYNFPMIHTDKYDPTDEDWNGFEKLINNYKSGAFLVNTLQEDSNIDLIKNIMQPMPNLMHVVNVAIESAGFTLEGDILNDTELHQALIVRDAEYFNRLNEDPMQIIYKNREWDESAYFYNYKDYVKFDKSIEIEKKGDYVLAGSVIGMYFRFDNWPLDELASILYLRIWKISGGVTTELFLYDINPGSDPYPPTHQRIQNIDVEVEVSFEVGDILRIEKVEPRRDSVPSETPDYPDAISLQLTPIRFRNPDGSPILSVLNLNEVDLTKVVPDMTVRDLFVAIKNFKNYGFIAQGSVVTMNKNQKALKRQNAVDLTDYEVEEPVRDYHEDQEYELVFADGKSDLYKYDSVLVRKDSVVINNYLVKDSTKSIKIDLLPLPVITRDNVTTAHNFDDDDSKLRIVFYKPMPDSGTPITYLNENALIPKIYENDYTEWLRYRINSKGWNWDFLISVEKLRTIQTQSLFFAYKNYHLFTEIEKERLNLMWWRVTAKSESLL